MEQPEKIRRKFGGGSGATFRQDGFPKTFKFRRSVLADPRDHFLRTFREDRICRKRMGAGWARVQLALTLEDGKMLRLHRTAYRRDQDRRMIPRVGPCDFEGGEQ